MIRRSDIVQWGVAHPWQNENQVEQDLLLSFAMVEIANDPLLGRELVLRGGTAFHKLFLPKPYRYSEDLDFVRTTGGGIGEVMKRLTSLGSDLYDLWLALTVLELDPEKIVAAYPAYRPEGVSGEDVAENLRLKLVDPEFRTDVLAMIRADAPAYDPDVADELVESELLRASDGRSAWETRCCLNEIA